MLLAMSSFCSYITRSVSSTRLLPIMILLKSMSVPAPKPLPLSTTVSPGRITGLADGLAEVQTNAPLTSICCTTGCAKFWADAARCCSRAALKAHTVSWLGKAGAAAWAAMACAARATTDMRAAKGKGRRA
ncbi:MAG: hypothetical protein QM742_17935 [Aquabacterium sp.]